MIDTFEKVLLNMLENKFSAYCTFSCLKRCRIFLMRWFHCLFKLESPVSVTSCDLLMEKISTWIVGREISRRPRNMKNHFQIHQFIASNQLPCY